MSSGLVQVGVILLLVVMNGVFALAEIALVSARKGRLRKRAEEGDISAQTVLELQEDPNSFLSTVQIGISTIGILSGALGSATLADSLGEILLGWGVRESMVPQIAFAIVVLFTTYFSLVIGELIPKRLGMSNPEGIAKFVARPMLFLSKIASPINKFLGWSTTLGLRILGIVESKEPDISEEEIRMMLIEGTEVGVFGESEHDMMEGVFRLGDRRIDMIVTPRTELEWLNLELPIETWDKIIFNTHYNQLPVVEGDLDQVVGVIRTRDLLKKRLTGESFDPRELLLPPVFIPESIPALVALERIKSTESNMGMVIDEYGGLLGIITLYDLMEAIIGSISMAGFEDDDSIVQRDDGSWLVDGLLPIDELKDLLNVSELSKEMKFGYQTMGGMMMAQMGAIPKTGQRFDFMGYRFEILDMDGHRVDKVLIMKVDETKDGDQESPLTDSGLFNPGQSTPDNQKDISA